MIIVNNRVQVSKTNQEILSHQPTQFTMLYRSLTECNKTILKYSRAF